METRNGLIIALYADSDCGLISLDGDRDTTITFFSDSLLQPVCERDRVQVAYGDDLIATSVVKTGEGRKPRNLGIQNERIATTGLGRGTVTAVYNGFGTIQAGDREVIFLTRLCPAVLAVNDPVAYDFETVNGKYRATKVTKLKA
jgi:hypothetical protein